MLAAESHVVEDTLHAALSPYVTRLPTTSFDGGNWAGACCAYHRGEKSSTSGAASVTKQTGELWEQKTMVIVDSATKGLAAMTFAIAHSRGWLDYEERVWRVLAGVRAAGQGERSPVRQLLAHQAGLFALDQPIDHVSPPTSIDLRWCWRGRNRPGSWGTRQAYHAINTWLLRERDPAPYRSATSGAWEEFFQDEIATPLGLDVYIRSPD